MITRKSSKRCGRSSCSGMTLVELLVVIFLLVSLTAAVIPAVRPAFASRKTREAARQINGFFIGAKARAAALGRPVGVWIERLSPGSGASMQLHLAEQPAPYAGDFAHSRAAVKLILPLPQFPAPNGRVMTIIFSDSANMWSQDRNLRLVNPGDEIQFNYGGDRYEILQVGVDTQTNLVSVTLHILAYPVPVLTPSVPFIGPNDCPPVTEVLLALIRGSGVPYQIFRQPRKISARPLNLPNGVVLDLVNSGSHLISPTQPLNTSLWNFSPINTPGADNGWGVAGQDDDGNTIIDDISESGWPGSDDLKDDDPIVIMFNPSGTVERVYWRHPVLNPLTNTFNMQIKGEHVTGSLYFLIGKADKMVSAGTLPWSSADTNTQVYNENLLDHTNLWVSVRIHTGNVTTAENGFQLLPTDNLGNPLNPTFLDSFNAARQFARSGIGMQGG